MKRTRTIMLAAAAIAIITYITGGAVAESAAAVPAKFPDERWRLATDDTIITVAISSNRPVIYELTNPAQGWNWIPVPVEFPLLGRVFIGLAKTPVIPDWKYTEAVVDESDGKKLTLRFASTTPRLELKSIWWARKGPGPVEHRVTIENQAGKDLIINGRDMVAADLPVVADNTVTLWRFNKTPRKQKEPDTNGFNRVAAGVFVDKLGPNTNIRSQVKNSLADAELPFEILDVGSRHGLYIGYTFGYGMFINTTDQDPRRVTSRFYLADDERVAVGTGVVFNIPGVFLGTYQGDADDGSNRMKKWFWNYKIPPFLKNPAEPLIEICCELTFESNVDRLMGLIQTNDFASWGVGIFKVDAGYAGDRGYCEPGAQPHVRITELADLIHSRKMKFAVWQPGFMPESDLLWRYDNWHYDYYRSDNKASDRPKRMYPYQDYWGQVDFLKKIDNLTAARPGFRWENCSAGGSSKAFDHCERMTFMTTTDDASSLGFRKAFYPNSYMINPVQLKSDCYCNDTYDLRSTMLGSIQVALTRWQLKTSSATKNEVLENKAFYADMQKHFLLYNARQVHILRGADVYHVLPMPDGINWDGLEFFNPSIKKGSVFLFKPTDKGGDAKVIKLKGLDREMTYALTFQDRTEQNVKKTGADLMDQGLDVTMTGACASEIIWIE